MEHVIAIAGLAAVCGLWYVIQKASGHLTNGGAGRCGMCGGDKSNCKRDLPGASKGACKSKVLTDEASHLV